MLTAAFLSAAVAMGAAVLYRLFRRKHRRRSSRLPSPKAFLDWLNVQAADNTAGGQLAGASMVVSDL